MSNSIDNLNGYASARLDQLARAANNRAAQSPSSNAAETARTPDRSDRVELSAEALKADGVRTDLVARIRAEIAAGTYETDAKLDSAADSLAKELGL